MPSPPSPPPSSPSITFTDYLNIHSSLVLLPYNDSDCTGCLLSTLLESSPTSSSPVAEGMRLSGIYRNNGTNTKTDWVDMHSMPFDKILSLLREDIYPATLVFANDTGSSSSSPPASPSAASPSPTGTATRQSSAPSPGGTRRESLSEQLSGWSSRFRSMSTNVDSKVTAFLSAGTTSSASGSGTNSDTATTSDSSRPHTTSSSSLPSLAENGGSSSGNDANEHKWTYHVQSLATLAAVADTTTAIFSNTLLVVKPLTPPPTATSTVSYQWCRSSSCEPFASLPLKNCTTSAYRINVSDVNRNLHCRVTVASSDGTSPSYSTTVPLPNPITLSSPTDEKTADNGGMTCAPSSLYEKLKSPPGFSVHAIRGRGSYSNRAFRLHFALDPKPVLNVYELIPAQSDTNPRTKRWSESSSPSTVGATSAPSPSHHSHSDATQRNSIEAMQLAEAIDVLSDAKDEVLMTENGLKVVTAHADPSHEKNVNILFSLTGQSGLDSAADGIKESPFLCSASSFVDREVLLLACAAVASNRGDKFADLKQSEVLLRDVDDLNEQGVEFDAAWESDGSGSDEEHDDDDDDDDASGLHTSMRSISSNHSLPLNTSSDDTDKGFKILSLETELLMFKKKMLAKDNQLRDAESEKESVERELYNASMNNSTLETELVSMHGKMSAIENEREELRQELVAKSEMEEENAKLRKELKSVGNEKSVLMARIQNLENKLVTFTSLQESAKKNEKKLSKASETEKALKSTAEGLEVMKNHCKMLETEMKAAMESIAAQQAQLATANQDLASSQKSVASLTEQSEALGDSLQKVTTERNGLKAKYASVAKDLGRLTKNNRSVKEIESLIASYENLAVQNSVLKAERNQALDDVKEYKSATETFLDSRKKAGLTGEYETALQVKAELERIISSLTETVQTKEMQMATMREVNRMLSEELSRERENNKPSGSGEEGEGEGEGGGGRGGEA
jgi:hypothetical protein